MVSTPLMVGDKEYHIRYTHKEQTDIRENVPTKFLPGSKIKRFQSPMEVSAYLNDIDIQIYLLKKGLEWSGSGYENIDTDKAADLRQEYLEQGEADSGEKLDTFLMIIFDALALNTTGASGKKLIEKGKAEKEKAEVEKKEKGVEELARIYEAQARAKARIAANPEPPGKTGIEQPTELLSAT